MYMNGSEQKRGTRSTMYQARGLVAMVALAVAAAGGVQQEAKAERTGEQVVKAQCAKCHATGEGGAPKIGDRAAWTPRLQQGLGAAVASAISGHGGMPARGGLADLTDAEVRNAVVYMFNPASGTAKAAVVTPPAVPAANRKTVGKMEVYLGVLSTASLPAESKKAAAGGPLHGGVPSGAGYYHVNISLIDSETKGEITDAKVEATVEDILNRSETKKLELVAIGNRASYGNYFEMPGKDPYSIEVKILRPGAAAPVTTKFSYKPN